MDMSTLEARKGHDDIENKKTQTLCQKICFGTVFSVY